MSEVVEQSGQLVANLIRTDEDIYDAAQLWRGDRAAAEARYGHISLWNTSAVTDMNRLFHYASDFRDDISQWDVSNVTTMHGLFWDAHSFNCDISNWETGKVTSMGYLFCAAHSFNCDVSEWDVSAVVSMNGAFSGCPVNFRAIWEEHKDDPEWKVQCRQNRELRREQIREQRRRDENWERRRPWMMVISPFLKQKGITESPIQSVFDIPDLARHINSFV
jgi:surface protein